MKTRIVYPQMWLDEKFAQCNVATKLLFCYLINNPQLGLSPYLHITDRQIMFDTGLNTNQLVTGKEELSKLGWVYFTENWCFHNHKAAYIDYDGRDRVLESKEQEIANVPNKVKEVFKGLLTGYQPVLNHKSEIINNKEGGVGETKDFGSLKSITQEVLQELASEKHISVKDAQLIFIQMRDWLESKGKTYKDYKAGLRNWINKKIEDGKVKIAREEKPIPQQEILSPEEREANLKRIAALKTKWNGGAK